jgi:FkbH-like protein
MKTEQATLLKSASGLIKQSRNEEALDQLRRLLRHGLPDAEAVDRAGRLIRRALGAGNGVRPLNVAMVGQFTTSWLATVLTAIAWGRGSTVMVSEGGYDTVLQDLERLPTGEGRPDVVVLLPWNQRLFGGDSPSDRVDAELEMWSHAWKIVKEKLGARLLQLGYDWVLPGALGTNLGGRASGRVHAVRTLNEEIRAHLPSGAYFVDLEQVSGAMGRDSFYDMRRYYWTKQPFSEEGTLRLATALWSGIRAVTTGPKKVLVVDLDNTVWGGVVGETGPLGVALGDSPDGEGFRAFQAHLKDLARQGVVLAVASKNNPADAREVFEKNPDMILGLDDFAAFEACWDPKALSIKRIAETLNLGLDSFVFFDDNPAEQELIRQALPDVEVVDVPVEPAEYVRALQAGGWFETAGLTDVDATRSAQYVVERKRRELSESFSSLDDYLRSLAMRGDVRDIDESDMMRVVQLLAKTNQFNVTTRRHTYEDLLNLIKPHGSIAMTLRMEDRFGDYGLVSVLIGVPADEPKTIRIDTWLMSCRVIGRTAEEFFFGRFLDRAKQLGYERIVGEYFPTKKNALVSDLYDKMGFTRLSGGTDSVRYELNLQGKARPICFISSPKPTVAAAELIEIQPEQVGSQPVG